MAKNNTLTVDGQISARTHYFLIGKVGPPCPNLVRGMFMWLVCKQVARTILHLHTIHFPLLCSSLSIISVLHSLHISKRMRRINTLYATHVSSLNQDNFDTQTRLCSVWQWYVPFLLRRMSLWYKANSSILHDTIPETENGFMIGTTFIGPITCTYVYEKSTYFHVSFEMI